MSLRRFAVAALLVGSAVGLVPVAGSPIETELPGLGSVTLTNGAVDAELAADLAEIHAQQILEWSTP